MSNVKKQVILCLASLMLAVLTVLTGTFPVGAVRCDGAYGDLPRRRCPLLCG